MIRPQKVAIKFTTTWLARKLLYIAARTHITFASAQWHGTRNTARIGRYSTVALYDDIIVQKTYIHILRKCSLRMSLMAAPTPSLRDLLLETRRAYIIALLKRNSKRVLFNGRKYGKRRLYNEEEIRFAGIQG